MAWARRPCNGSRADDSCFSRRGILRYCHVNGSLSGIAPPGDFKTFGVKLGCCSARRYGEHVSSHSNGDVKHFTFAGEKKV
jgi:hypothetical protein